MQRAVEELKPHGLYGYGESASVMTQMELEERLVEGTLPPAERVVMIQCVGSRNEERPYCSRICCSHAIKNALHLKEENPDRDVVILYQGHHDLRIPGEILPAARRAGVRFVRYDKEKPPVLDKTNGRLTLSCFDPSIMEELTLETDLLALSCCHHPQGE